MSSQTKVGIATPDAREPRRRRTGSGPRCRARAGITAAVVGVIADLALYFAVHTLFARSARHGWGPVRVELPVPGSVQPVAVAIALVAAALVLRLRWSVPRTLGVCALLGVATVGLT